MNELISKLVGENSKVIREQYEALVVSEIRKKYSQHDENAIIRKKLAGVDSGEFNEYNTYVENCKTKAREKLSFEDSGSAGRRRYENSCGIKNDLCDGTCKP